MFDTPQKRRELSKWLITTITGCILIYLCFRNISTVFRVLSTAAGLIKPLLIGFIFALILNVPMRMIEQWLQKHTKLKKGIRPLAIALSLIFVLGIFILVAVLVIPELSEALRTLLQIAVEELEHLADMNTNTKLTALPLNEYLSGINIDWLSLKTQLEEWVQTQSMTFANQAAAAAGSIINSVVTFFISFIFALYILADKETLKHHVCRLIRAWIPKKAADALIHAASVCNHTFRLFIAGQATEAVILGTLCMIGMLILRLPYAPMIGALVGVTALIPIVGAFAGTIVGAIMILTVSPVKAVVFVLFLLILQQIEGNLIYPRVVGSKLNLPAIWVLAAVTVGGNLGGPLGMLFGVPVTSALYALLKEATQMREQKLKKQ